MKLDMRNIFLGKKMKILDKEILGDVQGIKITKLVVSSPAIAQKAQPGQFIVLMASEKGERVPLTIVDADKNNGAITLILQEVGLTTKSLGKLNTGDSLFALVGPLGHPTQVSNYGKVILVGGGVGIAEIYPIAKALKAAGNQVTTILGARTKKLLILEAELKGASHEFFVTTDDGSYARKGFTTDVLTELLGKSRYDLVYAVGPIPMMKRVAAVTKGFGVKTVVSLNPLMVDATGMCGCCRVTVAGEVKFSCVDGPEFDAAAVDWDELVKRNSVYLDKEKHICRLNNLS
jgi:ferredoxin/flavodoxin---NADP+ reductase